MASYAIGDLQGCYDPFVRLVDRIGFDPDKDRLWMTGDFVNRGPKSLDVLRWMVEHESVVTGVLGNHDLYLLQRSIDAVKKKNRDTLDEVLRAPDRDRLLDWLRRRPLCVRSNEHLMVHAGLLPSWTADEAMTRAKEVEEVLQSDDGELLLQSLRGNGNGKKDSKRIDLKRLRRTVSVLTRLRMVDAKGEPDFGYDGPPESAPKGHRAWFDAPDRKSNDVIVIFGHWAALGFRRFPKAIALDSGCVWGNRLTAVRLDDGAVFQEPCLP